MTRLGCMEVPEDAYYGVHSLMYICTNKHKILACVKCPGSVNCPEYAGAAKKFAPKCKSQKELATVQKVK